MATKNQDDTLSGTALALRQSLQNTSITRGNGSRPITKAERNSMAEYRNQMRVIEMEWKKTVAGQTAIDALHVSSYLHAKDMAERIYALRETCTLPREFQDLLDAYAVGTVKQGIAYNNAATRTGSELIIEEIARSLYRATEEERLGILARFHEWLWGNS